MEPVRNEALLKELTQAFGVAGFEDNVREIIRREVTPYADEITEDAMGNLIVLKKGVDSPHKKRIMFAAHMDEIGFMVKKIQPDGTLQVCNLGWNWTGSAYNGRVQFANGMTGVVGCNGPIEEANNKAGKLFVDIGAKDKADAEKYVKLGDPIGYIGSVTNTTETSGGTEEEDDDELTERVFYAPEGYSVAGPALAYISLAKQFRSDVRDVTVVRPEGTAGTVEIYILLAGGKLPTASDLAALLEFLSDKTRRPLNDLVECKAPTEVPYTIDLTYTIAESDAAQVGTITEAVNQAVTDYADWQRTIGQDINPTALIAKVRDAGAKWVELRSPARSAVTKSQVPKLTTQNVVYGGTEDD